MSERGHRGGPRGSHRGGRGGGRGRGDGPSSGGHHGGQGGAQDRDRPKKENILNLDKYMNERITVKFNGGREGPLPGIPISHGS